MLFNTMKESEMPNQTASESNNSLETPPVGKLCTVCSDKANGMHFGALTCEGCKGFFRRSVKKNAHFICAFEKKCGITKISRKHCQACRFKACVDAGMQVNLVLSDEEVNKKRQLIKDNKEKRSERQAKKNEEEQLRLQKVFDKAGSDRHLLKMTMEDKLFIETLVRGHYESYDFGYREYDTFRGRDQIDLPPPKVDTSISGSDADVSLAWLTASLNSSSSAPGLKKYEEYENKATQNHFGTKKLAPSSNDSLNQLNKDVSTSHNVLQKSEVIMNPLTPKHSFNELKTDLNQRDSTNKEIATSSSSQSAELDIKSASSTLPSSDIKKSSSPTSHSSDMKSVFSSLHGTSTGKEGETSKDNALEVSSLKITKPTESECDKMVQNVSECLLRSQGVSLNDIDDNRSRDLFQHFADIMTWGIKKVIHFCKNIPEFLKLSLGDQIVLLRGGCLELLVLRSYFAFASENNTYVSEKFQYKPSDFLQAGASEEFIEKYNCLHKRMRKMKFQIEEICLLLALVLFSPDRIGLESKETVEEIQNKVVSALRAYEYTHRPPDKARNMYGEILLILPLLRTINALFSDNISHLQKSYESDINPLILEVHSDSEDDS